MRYAEAVKILNRVVTVDPGFNTGIALWDAETIKTLRPEYYSYSAPRVADFELRFKNLTDEFRNYIEKSKPHRVVIEDQWFSEASYTSVTSAKRGALKKLSWLVGAYIYICIQQWIPVQMISPIRWKGNMNDRAVRARIQLITGAVYSNSHIADAVGIGLDQLGLFKDIKQVREYFS